MIKFRGPEKDDFEFPNEIRAAFAAYPKPAPSANFNSRFWAALDAKRGYYRGFFGCLRRICEVEIEGVAVWRLAASTLSGGFLCLLLMGLMLGSSSPKNGSAMPQPSPANGLPPGAYAFYRRDWEGDLWAPEIAPPPRPPSKVAPRFKLKKEGEFSCKDSNASLV